MRNMIHWVIYDILLDVLWACFPVWEEGQARCGGDWGDLAFVSMSWFVSICLRMGIMEIASSHFLVLHINWSHKSCFSPFPATLAFPVSLGSCSNSGDLLDI